MKTEQPGTIEKATNWVRSSIMLKMVIIGVLILLLLIPQTMIDSLINERARLRTTVMSEISSKWGGEQTFTGPIISVPYIKTVYTNGQTRKQKHYAHFLPSKLDVNGKIIPDKKSRGIYDVIIYESDIQGSGEFKTIDYESLHIQPEDMIWDESIISIGISDMKGITSEVTMDWNGKKITMQPGVTITNVIPSGVHANINLQPNMVNSDPSRPNMEQPMIATFPTQTFSFSAKVNGSSRIKFTPIGAQTSVDLSSTWDSPKFDGAFLPQKSDVTKEGFTANWKVMNLNRNYPQQWTGNSVNFHGSNFGVDLILPVDEYQKTKRSSKYASLIILLTFVTFFFIELGYNIRIHPLQYVMVGSALILYYTLLLSISEHYGFNTAYITSTIMIAGLVGMYSRYIFPTAKMAALLTVGLGSIYAFMYFILISEDYALLMGSIGLFVILAIVMYSTRNIKFYRE